MIIVSACLLGINCKYNNLNNDNQKVREYLNGKEFVIACPEQLGGLSTPRNPSEIINISKQEVSRCKVISNKGEDVTENFVKGAKETLKIAKLYNCKEAIMKDGSPSCGSKYIYDGSFTGKKILGEGITSALLRKNNIKVISENEL
ncbi:MULTISPECIES: DUF523 domain-containing protein [unclassified Romboutsia]|uniref:DUF523 domain-containing protein n=1 Tax=unclassified Romboutsia TaxID=2626894 RepID=UPI00082269E2|nr:MULTISPECIES: DUF523 domain-containing protein [unclassified Romboutsia]SCH99840.1 Uncharacterized conserved protein [uncultured Clostridium sp.]